MEFNMSTELDTKNKLYPGDRVHTTLGERYKAAITGEGDERIIKFVSCEETSMWGFKSFENNEQLNNTIAYELINEYFNIKNDDDGKQTIDKFFSLLSNMFGSRDEVLKIFIKYTRDVVFLRDTQIFEYVPVIATDGDKVIEFCEKKIPKLDDEFDRALYTSSEVSNISKGDIRFILEHKRSILTSNVHIWIIKHIKNVTLHKLIKNIVVTLKTILDKN